MWIKANNFLLDSATVPIDIDEMLEELLIKYLRIDKANFKRYLINSKSVDARRGTPQFVYSIFAEVADNCKFDSSRAEVISDNTVWEKYAPSLEIPKVKNSAKAIVVGSGPAGIFGALALAEAGVKVQIIDRGFDVDTRAKDWEKFLRDRELNTESNLLIGEGGAGTFSDGKLYTRTKDKSSNYILKTFVDCGASPDTIYLKRPHLGSDKLPEIAKNLRKKIEELGGEFAFGKKVVSIKIENNQVKGVILSDGSIIEGDYVLLAHGLGGRELTLELAKKGVKYKLKSFQIGCRIEHPQLLIDRHQYRLMKRFDSLGAAEYNFVSKLPANNQDKILGVSSFCMCPGGEIVMASAWKGQLTTNGMSRHARDGKFANSCLIMTIDGDRFGTLEAAYKFLTKYEKAAFLSGNENYTIVGQSAEAFLNKREGLCREESSAQTGITSGRIDKLLSEELYNSLAYALKDFDKKCPGFIKEGQLHGIETCVSSPARFLRDETTLMSSVTNLFIGGEGAGCAGGIMSAAIDGIKLAKKIVELIR